MSLKERLKNGERGIRIRIEKCNLKTTEEVDEYIIDYIRNTLKEFGSKKYKNESSLPVRYTTVELQSGDEALDLLIKVGGQKVKEGLLQNVVFNITKF